MVGLVLVWSSLVSEWMWIVRREEGRLNKLGERLSRPVHVSFFPSELCCAVLCCAVLSLLQCNNNNIMPARDRMWCLGRNDGVDDSDLGFANN